MSTSSFSSVRGFTAPHVPTRPGSTRRLLCLFAVMAALLALPGHGQASNAYQQTNIISDGSVSAKQTDPTLINPWGVAIGQQTPFWVNDAGSGFSAVYDAAGNKSFAVTVPPRTGGTGKGLPSGIAFNAAGSGFILPGGTTPATFIFVTLDGTISGWNANTPNAVLVVDNSANHASYTGTALAMGANGQMLLAANFAKGTVDAFDPQFKPITLPGGFADTSIPSGFAPFNVHVLNGNIFVTYAQQPPTPGPAVTGAGLGYVDEFDSSGKLMQRVASGGTLNAPWGMVFAPSGFGAFGGDLLIGNFGDGTINAFDPSSFAFKGQLQDSSGKTIANSGLWELLFGAQGTGDPNTLYFAAGINDEKDGLFGSISVAQAAQANFTLTAPSTSLSVTAAQAGSLMLTLAPANGFTGTVALSCSGLPSGLGCSLSPNSITLNGATATTTLSVSESASTGGGGGNPYTVGKLSGYGLTAVSAALAPGLLGLAFYRRRKALTGYRILFTVALLAGSISMLSGCGGSAKMTPPPSSNPVPAAGSYPMTITATSGALTQTTQITVTVN